MSRNKDHYYDVLGVSSTASDREIREAFRKLARMYHPDRVEASRRPVAEARFQEITEAYNLLGDRDKREAYDAARQGGVNAGAARDPRELARVLLSNAVVAARDGKPQRARELFEQAVAHDETSAQAHHLFGTFLLRQGGDANVGLRHLDEAVRLAPLETRILLDASRGFAQAGMLGRAMRFAQSAREVEPGNADVEAWWLKLQAQRGTR